MKVQATYNNNEIHIIMNIQEDTEIVKKLSPEEASNLMRQLKTILFKNKPNS